MNFLKSSTGLFTLVFLLLILTNIIVLMNVSSNRSGETTSIITLSERELATPYAISKENSGISLKIKWRVLNEKIHSSYSYNQRPPWLDEIKLQELGFNTQKYKDKKNFRSSSLKELFLVLEYNGESYQRTLQLAKNNLLNKKSHQLQKAKEALHVEQISASRLFVIDAGISYKKLRQKYKDSTKYIITKGLVKFSYNSKTKKIYGYINQLSIKSLHVELNYREILKSAIKDKVKNHNKDVGPSFEVTLNYGSNYEPWISDIKRIKK